MNVSEDIKRKIRDYFNGQLSPVEEADLIQWIKLDADNKAYFLNFSENIDPEVVQHPLLQSSYSELKNKILISQQFNPKPARQPRKLVLTFLKAAAILVFGLFSGYAISLLTQKDVQPKTEISWFETKVPRGEKSQLVLPDGSKVWINSESSISYPSNFLEGNRDIKLTGEAYFEVAKFKEQPFVVETPDYNIRVTGTKFNVMAYSDFNRTETSLIEGKINIQRGKQDIPVAPGQSFAFANNKFILKNNKVDLAAKWKDDIFDFDQITFKELVSRLERWYDVDIEIKNPELYEIVYSGVFKNEETIWQVFDTFELTLPIHYERVGFRDFVIEKNKTLKK